jgi:hypothetical protein
MALNGDRTRTRRSRLPRDRAGDNPQPKRPVLDQAIAINGDLRVQLFGLNLLPIKVRLLVSSKEVAAELGLDWWANRPKSKGRRNRSRNRPQRDGG